MTDVIFFVFVSILRPEMTEDNLLGKGFPQLSVREQIAADKASVLYQFTDILVVSRIGVVAVAVVDAYLVGLSAQRVCHGVQTRGEPV